LGTYEKSYHKGPQFERIRGPLLGELCKRKGTKGKLKEAIQSKAQAKLVEILRGCGDE